MKILNENLTLKYAFLPSYPCGEKTLVAHYCGSKWSIQRPLYKYWNKTESLSIDAPDEIDRYILYCSKLILHRFRLWRWYLGWAAQAAAAAIGPEFLTWSPGPPEKGRTIMLPYFQFTNGKFHHIATWAIPLRLLCKCNCNVSTWTLEATPKQKPSPRGKPSQPVLKASPPTRRSQATLGRY